MCGRISAWTSSRDCCVLGDLIVLEVDRYSKYAHFLRLRHPFTAKSVAELFCSEIVKLHGIPASIVSDRDKVFVSSFWRELFKVAGTTLKMSSSRDTRTTDRGVEPLFGNLSSMFYFRKTNSMGKMVSMDWILFNT